MRQQLVLSVFQTPPLGTNFALFYAAGTLPLMMYTDYTAKMAQTIQFSRTLLAYPRVTILDAWIARFVLNALTQMIVHFVILGFILIALQPTTTLDYAKIG